MDTILQTQPTQFQSITPKNLIIEEVQPGASQEQQTLLSHTHDIQSKSFDKRNVNYLDKQRKRRLDSKKIEPNLVSINSNFSTSYNLGPHLHTIGHQSPIRDTMTSIPSSTAHGLGLSNQNNSTFFSNQQVSAKHVKKSSIQNQLSKTRYNAPDSKKLKEIILEDNFGRNKEKVLQNEQHHYSLQTEEVHMKSPLDTSNISSTFKADEIMHNFIFKNSSKSLNRYEKFKRNQRLAMLNQSLDLQQDSLNSYSKEQQHLHHLQNQSKDASTKTRFLSQHNYSFNGSQAALLNQTLSTTKTNGFKEFRITNDLKEIDKWLDKKEMLMEGYKKEIHADGAKQQDQEKYLVQYYSMFHSAFKEILKLIPDKNQDLIAILSRVHTGYKDCFSQFQQKIKSIYLQSQESMDKMRTDYKILQDKFEEFQQKNDLNKYFTKNLDAQTRERVIKDIQELSQEEWSISIDKSLLEIHRFSESTKHLSDINQDYEQTIKERLNFYMHQNEKDQDSQQVPIPAQTYKLQFDQKLNQNYNFAVQTTAKKIVARLLGIYKKETQEVSVQTSSFDEIKQAFETQIRSLEKSLENKEHEKEQVMREIEKAKLKLDKINKEKKRLEKEFDEIQTSLDNQKEQQKSTSNENIELRTQLKAVQKKLHKIEELEKLKDAKIKQLMDENYELKKQVPKLTRKVAKYKKKIEVGAEEAKLQLEALEESKKLPKFDPKAKKNLNIQVNKAHEKNSDSLILSDQRSSQHNKYGQQNVNSSSTLEMQSQQSQTKIGRDSQSPQMRTSQFKQDSTSSTQLVDLVKKNISNKLLSQLSPNKQGSETKINHQIQEGNTLEYTRNNHSKFGLDSNNQSTLNNKRPDSPIIKKVNNEMDQHKFMNKSSELTQGTVSKTQNNKDKIGNSQSKNPQNTLKTNNDKSQLNNRGSAHSRSQSKDGAGQSTNGNNGNSSKPIKQQHNKSQSQDTGANKTNNKSALQGKIKSQIDSDFSSTQSKFINSQGKQKSDLTSQQNAQAQTSSSHLDNEDLRHLKSFGNIKSNLELQEIQEEEAEMTRKNQLQNKERQLNIGRNGSYEESPDYLQGSTVDVNTSPISQMKARYFKKQEFISSIISSPRGEKRGSDQVCQTLIRGNMLEDFVVTEDEQINNLTISRDKKSWNEACQTESYEYIDYMSTLYFNELRLQLKQELSQHELTQIKVLLEKSKAVIDKIKFKASQNQLKYQPLYDEKAQNYLLSTQDQQHRKDMHFSKHFIMNNTPQKIGDIVDQGQSTGKNQRSKQYGSNMYFSRGKSHNNTSVKNRGKYIGGIADEIELMDPEILRQKQDIENYAIRVIHKFSVGGGQMAQIQGNLQNSVGTSTNKEYQQ
eukprot:403368500